MATFDRLSAPTADEISSKRRSLAGNGLNNNVQDSNNVNLTQLGNTNIAKRGTGLLDLTKTNAMTSGNAIRQDAPNSFTNLRAPGQATVSNLEAAPTVDQINRQIAGANTAQATKHTQRVAQLQSQQTQSRVNALHATGHQPSGFTSEDPRTFRGDLHSIGNDISRSLTNSGNAFGAGIDAASEGINELLDSRSAPFTNETLFSALSNAPKREPNAVERYFGLGGD